MRSLYATALCLAGALTLTACEDDPPAAAPPPARPATPANAQRTGPAQNAAADAGLPPLVVTDNTFIESRQVRDPFHNNAESFVTITGGGGEDTRAVLLARYSLDDLQLVAVIVGTDSPYAMVRDPSGAGTILRRGALVGRGEMIHSNIEGRQDYFVHWRVSRINPARLRRAADGQFVEIPAELVLERPDPLNPNAQVVERALAMVERGQQAPSQVPVGVGMPLPGATGPTPGFLPSFVPGQSPQQGAQPGAPQGAPPQQGAAPAQRGGAAQQPPTTTVIVQQPPPQAPQAPTVIPPSNDPPPVRITGGESSLR
ncbi:MAG: hypothetical protein R3A52_09550 [Polyangiales bacterium]